MIIEEKRYGIDEVFDMIGEKYLTGNLATEKNKYNMVVDGFNVRPLSLRYKTFYQKGTKCVCCGKEGTHFKLCGNENTNRRHFNLYADDGTLITKDHIIPKSRGGRDVASNMQTMCEPCNKAKGASCPGFTYIIGTNRTGKEIKFTTIEKASYHVAINLCKLGAKKVKKDDAIKAAIGCVVKIQSAIKNKTEYQGYYWEERE